jgi:hypothetical protein
MNKRSHQSGWTIGRWHFDTGSYLGEIAKPDGRYWRRLKYAVAVADRLNVLAEGWRLPYRYGVYRIRVFPDEN